MEIIPAVSSDLDEDVRAQLRLLWNAAFRDFSDQDAAHAFGGVHVLAYDGSDVVGHASAVPRTVHVGDQPWDTGYVEAVAVSPACQGSGIGSALMRALQGELRDRWPFGALSTSKHGFYEQLGWERWRGTSYVRMVDGRRQADGEHGGLMVLRFGPSADVDLTASITCEDRPGDAW
ncbi:MAG: GNAT family N-acetyltransferase [Nocardioides sp.]